MSHDNCTVCASHDDHTRVLVGVMDTACHAEGQHSLRTRLQPRVLPGGDPGLCPGASEHLHTTTPMYTVVCVSLLFYHISIW